MNEVLHLKYPDNMKIKISPHPNIPPHLQRSHLRLPITAGQSGLNLKPHHRFWNHKSNQIYSLILVFYYNAVLLDYNEWVVGTLRLMSTYHNMHFYYRAFSIILGMIPPKRGHEI